VNRRLEVFLSRTEETKQLLDERGARWTQRGGTAVVDDFGEPEAEYQSMVAGDLGLIERGERETLVISGPEAIPWLQGLVTNDLHDLVEPGSGQRNAVVNTTGRFIADPRVLHIPELLVADLEPGTLTGGLWSHLRGQIILEDVDLDDRSEATGRIGVYGRSAAQLLDDLADWERAVGDCAPFCGTWGRWNGHDLVVQRMVWNQWPTFEIFCDVGIVAQLLEALDRLGDEPTWFGDRVFENLRIEAGIPRFGVELDDKVIPLEAGFDDAIAYDKGCYLGQEIIARLDTRGTPAKILRRVIVDGDEVPTSESEILEADGGERSIGDVRSATYSSRLDAPVALAYVKRKYNELGNLVVIDGMEGTLEGLLAVEQLD